MYTGITFVEADLLDADARHPASAELVGGGFLFALGTGKGFLAHRETDGSLHVYAAPARPRGLARRHRLHRPAAAKAAVLADFAGWDAELRDLIADARHR